MASGQTYASLVDARENLSGGEENYVVETPDFIDSRVTPPGEYLSQSRTVTKVKNKPDGSIVFELSLTGGVRTLDGGFTYGGGQYPFRAWLSTKTYEQLGRPGATSQVAQYLKAAGFNVKDLTSKAAILDAMEASLSTPLKVYIGWQDKGEKLPDNTYTCLNLKTKDFITGQNGEGKPVYSPEITRDGKVVKATEKVGGFRSFE